MYMCACVMRITIPNSNWILPVNAHYYILLRIDKITDNEH